MPDPFLGAGDYRVSEADVVLFLWALWTSDGRGVRQRWPVNSK